jgi:hypothetical protein
VQRAARRCQDCRLQINGLREKAQVAAKLFAGTLVGQRNTNNNTATTQKQQQQQHPSYNMLAGAFKQDGGLPVVRLLQTFPN